MAESAAGLSVAGWFTGESLSVQHKSLSVSVEDARFCTAAWSHHMTCDSGKATGSMLNLFRLQLEPQSHPIFAFPYLNC